RVLPDERVIDRLSRVTVPHYGRLTLVRHADRRKIRGAQSALVERFADHFLRPPPDLLRIVLHPTGLRIDLLVLALGARHHPARALKHDEARPGGALVNCSYIAGHRG